MVQDRAANRSITTEEWTHRKEIFLRALGQSGADRAAYLDRACEDDAALREAVESLLDAAGDDTSPLDVPAADRLFAGTTVGAEPLMPGDIVGRYRILKRIGQGGTSVVYLAERTDLQTKRRYAVKLIASGFMPLMRERFERECEILATLEHPNIARILDKGVCGDDWPYLVMDFVQGVPIQQYVREHELPPPEIARLFRECCAAVAHIHDNGVAHCDLKPNNILVDDGGSPRILDFGIAHLVEPQAQKSPGRTTRGARPLTPEYASPEQLMGEPLTPSTDIYSLGVILYELLTGSPPFEANDRTWAQIAHEILEEELRPPSQVAAARPGGKPGRGRWQIGRDLDSIVLRALATRPSGRYQSVRDFESDLGLYLSGDPVTARKPTLGNRLVQAVVRRRSAIAKVAPLVLAVALTGGLVHWLDAAARGREVQQLTTQHRRTAQWLADSMDREFTGKYPGLEARKQLFRVYLRLLEQTAAGSLRDPELDMVLARAYCRAGDLAGDPFQLNLGDPAAARKYYGEAVRRAGLQAAPRARLVRSAAFLGFGDLLAQPPGELDPAPAAGFYRWSATEAGGLSNPQARRLRSLGLHRLGLLYEQTGRITEAQLKYREALAAWPQGIDAPPETAPEVFRALFPRRLQADAAGSAERISLYRAIRRDLAALADHSPEAALAAIDLALTAGAIEMAADPSTAVADFENAAQQSAEMELSDPENAQWRLLHAIALGRMAWTREQAGRPVESETLAGRGLRARFAAGNGLPSPAPHDSLPFECQAGADRPADASRTRATHVASNDLWLLMSDRRDRRVIEADRLRDSLTRAVIP